MVNDDHKLKKRGVSSPKKETGSMRGGQEEGAQCLKRFVFADRCKFVKYMSLNLPRFFL